MTRTFWILAGLVGLVGLAIGILLIGYVKRRWRSDVLIVADIGREVPIEHDIAVQQLGRVGYQGMSWKALNVGKEDLRAGERAVIVGIDGERVLISKVPGSFSATYRESES